MKTKLSQKDKKFYLHDPEPGFSPERNKAIVDKTIKKYEAMRALKRRLFNDQLLERTDAIASYLTSNEGAHRERSPERYFGKRYLAYLRGEEIVDEIRERVKFARQSDIVQLLDTKRKAIRHAQKEENNKVQ